MKTRDIALLLEEEGNDGGVERIRSRRRHEHEADDSEKRNRSPKKKNYKINDVPEEVRVVKKEKEKAQNNNKPSPFGRALFVARQITARQAQEEQPELFASLQEAIDQLDGDSRRNLVFRLQGETMEDKCRVAGLYATARMCKMLSVAAATAAVKATGLTFASLLDLGLVEIRVRNNKPYTVYRFGHENLAKAASQLRRSGNTFAAERLEKYLSQGEKAKAFRQRQAEGSES
jgi:hypothetical protein